ncbi:MAG TPA: ABC transporter ATP-binding protein [Bacteroidales bacterium]|nr:ABC transporter ATP-binding protein [Bacteroidales bacterium]
MNNKHPRNKPEGASLLKLLRPYRSTIIMLIVFALLSNAVNLIIPKIISHGIDDFSDGTYNLKIVLIEFLGATLAIFIFTYLQSIVQTLASERAARDLRSQLSDKISRQSYAFVLQSNPSKLLTNLTSDIDSIKLFISHAVASIVSSIFVIIGASILLISINWKLALIVLAIIPIIGISFFMIFRKVTVLFKRSREIIDWLNKVITESILGAALIRVLNSQQTEYNKFIDASTSAKDLGISILKLFATLIPIITFTSNLAMLGILALGGHYVIIDKLSLGDFAAFNSYLVILIFPIIVIGFMSNLIAQSSASYQRIVNVLEAPDPEEKGTLTTPLQGNIEVKNVNLSYQGKPTLKNISILIKGATNTAIIGPTAAGKTQLLHLLTALTKPDSGTILFDGSEIDEYQKEAFHKQIGFVFQDSIIFNMSLRENIAFSEDVTEEFMQKAIDTAELNDFVDSLPLKLDTIISERGSNLSGGQKQRIMLARALANNPKILFLDDFTARVDKVTENKILCNLVNNYPELTLVSVTQKINSVKHFDQIIVVMEGEIIATGKHEELKETCPEYVQIYNSQRSTSFYELQS